MLQLFSSHTNSKNNNKNPHDLLLKFQLSKSVFKIYAHRSTNFQIFYKLSRRLSKDPQKLHLFKF